LLPATLYLIATPIGNLEDITLRALRILRDEAAIIACEDTRQTQKLLAHYQIRKRLISYHEHNEARRTAELVQHLAAGEAVALVSDAGTPLISDPGYRLVTAAIQNGFPVVPVPGASALMAAMAASGLPVHELRFIGFLPFKSGQRRKALDKLATEAATVVAFESPHRILATLRDLAEICPHRQMVLAREMTKIHEEFVRGSATEVLERLAKRPSVKGEITLVISGAAVDNNPHDRGPEGFQTKPCAPQSSGGSSE
jgi:16S rRNA (cytidine1402-2'-O)-methyltransferase